MQRLLVFALLPLCCLSIGCSRGSRIQKPARVVVSIPKNLKPIQFLDYLATNSGFLWCTVDQDSLDPDWIDSSSVAGLVERMGSKRTCTPVFSAEYSTDMSYKIRTTEGVEAAFLLESLRRKCRYPCGLGSFTVGVQKGNRIELRPAYVDSIQVWYRDIYSYPRR